MAKHKTFTVAVDVKVYFCDPQSLGSAVPTKTPTGCYDSIFLKEPICQSTRKQNSTR
jgi:hypothetical protein